MSIKLFECNADVDSIFADRTEGELRIISGADGN